MSRARLGAPRVLAAVATAAALLLLLLVLIAATARAAAMGSFLAASTVTSAAAAGGAGASAAAAHGTATRPAAAATVTPPRSITTAGSRVALLLLPAVSPLPRTIGSHSAAAARAASTAAATKHTHGQARRPCRNRHACLPARGAAPTAAVAVKESVAVAPPAGLVEAPGRGDPELVRGNVSQRSTVTSSRVRFIIGARLLAIRRAVAAAIAAVGAVATGGDGSSDAQAETRDPRLSSATSFSPSRDQQPVSRKSFALAAFSSCRGVADRLLPRGWGGSSSSSSSSERPAQPRSSMHPSDAHGAGSSGSSSSSGGGRNRRVTLASDGGGSGSGGGSGGGAGKDSTSGATINDSSELPPSAAHILATAADYYAYYGGASSYDYGSSPPGDTSGGAGGAGSSIRDSTDGQADGGTITGTAEDVGGGVVPFAVPYRTGSSSSTGGNGGRGGGLSDTVAAVAARRSEPPEGFFGRLAAQLLGLVNGLAAAVPQLGSIANATTAALGLSTSQRRNTTTALQTNPNRTAGFYTAGTAAVDPTLAAALASGYSASVAKDIVTSGAPTASFGAAGQTIAVGNTSTPGPGDTGARALTGGLTLAGEQAVPTRVTFTIGPVLNVFSGGRRTGASSQNGAAVEGTGQASDMTVISSSLATYAKQQLGGAGGVAAQRAADQSQAALQQQMAQDMATQQAAALDSLHTELQRQKLRQQLQRQQKQNQQNGGNGGAGGGGNRATQALLAALQNGGNKGKGGGSSPPAQVPPPQQPPAQPGPPQETGASPPRPQRKQPPQRANSGGASGFVRVAHRDLPNFNSNVLTNSAGLLQTFGATNLFGWTRGSAEASAAVFGTESTAARASGGAFGTGAASSSTFVVGVTPLQDVVCLPKKPQPHPEQQQGPQGGNALQDLLHSAAVAPLPAELTASSGGAVDGLEGASASGGQRSGGVVGPAASAADCEPAPASQGPGPA